MTGGPGTGKTTIVTELLTALAPSSPRVALCAPTGKATARLLTTVGALAADVGAPCTSCWGFGLAPRRRSSGRTIRCRSTSWLSTKRRWCPWS
ncbi:AAA family ATPase [Tessaracoccus sp.]|uniref:AAA family ATPase n=1 Tax=Tessaracoccus sp. TaxID=1971211 RepID=UPI0026148EB5|nr:AAA family ATPase [Tessaracoccus sp.]